MIRSELVQLWKSRVQYLRQYYCFNGHRPKQRGYPVLSRHVWFIPFILTAWWLLIAVIFLYKLKMQDLLNNGCTECDFRLVNGTGTEGRVEICINGTVFDQMWSATDASVVCKQLGMSSTGDITRYLLALNFLLVLLWWKFAINESEGMLRPHPYKGPCCSMCTNCKLQYGCTTAYKNASINTLPPLHDDWKWYRRRRSLFTIHYSDLQVLAPLTLLLCGDVETNPGPDIDEKTLLSELAAVEIKWFRIGIQLGIKGSKLKTFEENYSSTYRCLMETVSYWLDGNTNVPVSWKSVVTVLNDPSVDESGIAKQIQEKYCSKKGGEKYQEPLTVSNAANVLLQLSDKWIVVASSLGLPGSAIDVITVSSQRDNQVALKKVVEWWFTNTANPEWDQIHQVLNQVQEESSSIPKEFQEKKDLHNAAKEGNLEEVKRLITKGVDPLSKDSYNDTAIHIAAENGKLEVIKYLTEDLDCNPSLPGWHGTTPLHRAAEGGHLSIVQYLMDKHNANPLDKDEDSCLPLHRACIGGSLEVVKHLIQSMLQHMSINDILTFPTKFKNPPIHEAALNGHTNIIKFLIEECRCDPNLLSDGRGPLFDAAQKGHLSTVKYLIVECGCDPASIDTNQDTPLHLTAKNGHLETVKYLTADRKCKPTTRNNYNRTPMHSAALQGHSDVVEYFITVMQCSPHLPGQYGRSPLHDASNKGHLHLVKNLIEKHGCDPNVLDEHNSTPLHLAAQFGHLSVVQYLTKNKDCNVNPQNKKTGTPLHSAAIKGHLAIAKHLVEQAHCPPNIQNNFNRTPLQVALAKGHSEVVDYLRTL